MAKYVKQRSKATGKAIASAVTAILLALVIAAGVCCLGFASRGTDGKWFGNFKDMSSWHWTETVNPNNPDEPENPDNPNKPDEPDKPVADDKGGAAIDEIVNGGIALQRARLPRSAFAANGISEQAESAYLLTASITPAEAADKRVDWKVEWVDANGAFASGKSVTDYVTITPTSDGALTANAECKQAFGDRILITVTSRIVSSVKATCYVDYERKVDSVNFKATCNKDDKYSLNLQGDSAETVTWKFLPFEGEYSTFNHTWLEYGNSYTDVMSDVYTKDCTVTGHSITFEASPAMKSYLDNDSTIPSVNRRFYRNSYTYASTDIFRQLSVFGSYEYEIDGIFKFWIDSYDEDGTYDYFPSWGYTKICDALKACAVDFNITVNATLSNGSTYSTTYGVNVDDDFYIVLPTDIKLDNVGIIY